MKGIVCGHFPCCDVCCPTITHIDAGGRKYSSSKKTVLLFHNYLLSLTKSPSRCHAFSLFVTLNSNSLLWPSLHNNNTTSL